MAKSPNSNDSKSKGATLRPLAELAGAVEGNRTKNPDPAKPADQGLAVESSRAPSPAAVSTTRTLTLRRGGVEQGVVRQSFSHGRSKAVVIEKVKRHFDADRAAAQLVDQARDTRANKLDLSHVHTLERLPSLVGLEKLRDINLRGTKITDIRPISVVANLQHLNVNNTPVATLSPLSGMSGLLSIDASDTTISDLEGLRKLNRLQTLLISNTKVVSLAPLAELNSLEKLDISKTEVGDLSPLASLEKLASLEAQDTLLVDLASIASRNSLRFLNIQSTAVSNLMPLAKLKKLRRLIINSTKVHDLSPIADLTNLVDGAIAAPDSDGIQFHSCPIADPNLLKLAGTANPSRTAETIKYLQQQASQQKKTDEDSAVPSAETIPAQVKAAIGFTSASLGPLNILADDPERTFDPEQAHLYSRLRGQLSEMLENVPSQERTQVTDKIEDFLDQPPVWDQVNFKKTLWLCGNSLRNLLAQHDAVSTDPEPHYAKLPPATAEVLRQPIETWNIVVLGDPILRELDAQRLGPRERQSVTEQLEAAKPILGAAAADRGITTAEAAATIEISLAAAQQPADNIHTGQAQILVRGTSQNLVVQILRGAYRIGQELQNPQSEEAKNFVKEYKSGIYKKLGEWTVTGSVVAAGASVTAASGALYYYSTPFFEFVVTQGPWLKAYLVLAFDNPQLSQIVDWVTALRAKLLKPTKTKS